MGTNLSTELFWLVATTTMTALFWVPYILNRIIEQGGLPAFWDPDGITESKVPWAQRMMSAHKNATENLVLFAALVLVLHAANISNDTTALACMVYFFARAAHYIIFTFKVPLLRIVTFLIGFFAQMVLVLTIFGVL